MPTYAAVAPNNTQSSHKARAIQIIGPSGRLACHTIAAASTSKLVLQIAHL
jgi:hypothetical protein